MHFLNYNTRHFLCRTLQGRLNKQLVRAYERISTPILPISPPKQSKVFHRNKAEKNGFHRVEKIMKIQEEKKSQK